MKKILTLLAIFVLTTSVSQAATSYSTSLKNAIKTDINNTKTSIKNAAKADAENAKKERAAKAAVKKENKLKQIDSKLTELNKEMETVKNQKTGITESERTLRMNMLQKQINFYNKQKAALK